MSDTITIKLPNSVINVHLPVLSDTGASKTIAGSTRITEQINTRVTRGGNTRVTRDYSITEHAEIVVMKLPDGIVTIPVESE